MKPYLETDHATLYLGDACDVLPTLARDSVDLLVTDPPYGVGWQSGMRAEAFGRIAGDDGSLDVPAVLALATNGALRNTRHVYVFGYAADVLREPLRLGGTAGLVWDKGQLGLGDLSSPWGPSHERLTFGVHVRSEANRSRGDGRLAARLRSASVLRIPRPNSRAVKRHPTEKPVALMRLLVESSSLPDDVVLDPFAGVGATLVAAVVTGRRAIGVEIDERYAEITAGRLRDAEALASDIAAL